MQKLKKPLSLLLSIIMIFSMLTIIPVSAAEAQPAPDDISEASENQPVNRRLKSDDLAETGAEVDLTGTGHYDIAVGSEVVTEGNCKDVLGNGKVSYDPKNKVLTLRDPYLYSTYKHQSDYGAIHIQTDGVTVRGSYHMSSALSQYGLYVSGNNHVTLEGNFTFRGTQFGIIGNNLTFNSGTIKAVSGNKYLNPAGIYSDNLTINSGITSVEMQCASCAFEGDKLTLNGVRVSNDDSFYFPLSRAIVNPDLTDFATRVVIKPWSGTYYDLWLGTRHVDSSNYSDIYGDGTASFDPNNKILTLNDPAIRGAYIEGDTHSQNYKIYTKYDLTVKGSYKMTADQKIIAPDTTPDDNDDGNLYLRSGIYSTGKLTLDGDFAFVATMFPVCSEKNLTVNTGTVKAFGSDNIGIGSLQGALTVKSAVTKVDAESDIYPLVGKTGITIEDGVHVSTPSNSGLAYDKGKGFYYFINTTNNTTARHIVIESGKVEHYDIYLAQTEVTSANCDDIFGDGKASYSPTTQTLILHEPDIVGFVQSGSYTYKILTSRALTIKGSYHMSAAETDVAVSSMKSLTFEGDFTLMGNGYAAYGPNGVTIKSGTFTGISSGVGAVGAIDGELYIGNGITKVDLQAASYAILAKKLSLIGVQILEPASHGLVKMKTGDEEEDYVYTISSTSGDATRLVLEPITGDSCDVWLGTRLVTTTNCNDIFKDGGSAVYDPDAHTLTLNGATIPGNYKNGSNTFKIFAINDLTVEGNYALSEAETSIAIYSYDTLTLNGDFDIKATNFAVYAENGINITGGSLTADSGVNGIITNGALYVGDNVTRIDSTGGKNAILGDPVTISDELMISEPSGGYVGYVSAYEGVVDSSGKGVKHAIIERKPEPTGPPATAPTEAPTQTPTLAPPTEAPSQPPTTAPTEKPTEPSAYTEYNLWLGSTRVTSANMNDILKDGGKAKYDPSTRVLTLNDPVISGEYKSSKIYVNTTVTINGSYHMTSDDAFYGLQSYKCYLTLSGDFTFIGTFQGIDSDQYLTIASGTLKAVGIDNYGIYSNWEMTIGEDVRRVEIEGGDYAYWGNDILVRGDQQVTYPEGGYINYADIYDADGNYAVHAIIEKTYSIGLEGSGSESAPYLIKTSDDWNTFTSYVINGGKTSGKYFKLENDITVTTAINTNAFSGTFDGDGHTLTLNNLTGSPFGNINGATIKNLTVDGSVSGTRHISALVGGANGTADNLIENCTVAASISCSEAWCGGFVGHGGNSSKTTLKDCVFSGTISGATLAGTFWGWSDKGSTPVLENCFDISSSEHPIGRSQPQNASVTNCYYTYANKKTDGDRIWSNRGRLVHKITGDDVELTLIGSYGFIYDGTIYGAEGDILRFTTPDKDILYSLSAGTFTQYGSGFAMTVPACDVTVSKSGDVHYKNYNSVSANTGYNSEGAGNLFDSNTGTKWCGTTADGKPVVTFRTATNFIPKGYILATANDTMKNPGRNPIAWTLEAGNNGEDWVTLSNVSDNRTLESVNFTPYAFSISNAAENAYSFYRFTVNAITSGTTFQISELQLIGIDTGEEPPALPLEEYDIWLGSVRANSLNKDDILGDGGKAKFDPETNTLTLNEPVISGKYKLSKIYGMMDLTVKGNYHMDPDNMDAEYAMRLSSNGNKCLTLNGDFTLCGIWRATYEMAPLVLEAGNFVFYGRDDEGLFSRGALYINNSVERVEAITENFRTAVYTAWFWLDGGMFITTPEDGILKDHKIYYADGSTVAKRFVIERGAGVKFDTNGIGEAPAAQYIHKGETVTKPDDPTELGYTFEGWYTDQEFKNPFDFSDPLDDIITLYAKWAQEEYTVTVVADNGTAAKYVEATKFCYGDEYTLPECIFAVPELKAFSSWDKGKAGEKITITSDTVITAVWRDVYKLGDVDGDGEVTIIDATFIQRYLANLPISAYNADAADADGDGEVTILDATSIQRWLAGLPSNSMIGKLF